MSEWWVGRRGADPVGPVSTETLVRGVREKKVPPNALVCRVGEQQWHHVAQVDELWDRINPEEARTAVTEKPWFSPASDPAPANALADADAEDDATRIYAAPSPSADHTQSDVTESPTVPLVTSTTFGTTTPATETVPRTAANASADATARVPRPTLSKAAPAKTSAPAFRAPASLTKAAKTEAASSSGSGGPVAAKEPVHAPKAVIPAPRFGVDRVVPASPIAAGAFISKPPSVRPEPMTDAAPTGQSSPPPARQSSPPPARQSSPPPARQSSRPAARENGTPAAKQNTLSTARQKQSSPPSARENAAAAARATLAHATRQSTAPSARESTAAPRQPALRAAAPPVTEKARQPIPPVPAAVIPLPQDSEIASLVRDNADVSLTQTRPDRPDRRSKDAEAVQRPGVIARSAANSAARDTGPLRPVVAAKTALKQPAPRPGIPPAGTPEPMPRIEARPIVAVADATDDDDATVVRDLRAVLPPQPAEPPERTPPRTPPEVDEEAEDATVVFRPNPSSPPAAVADDDATVVRNVRLLPEVGPTEDTAADAAAHSVPRTPPAGVERLATSSRDTHSGERPVSPAIEQPEPAALSAHAKDGVATHSAAAIHAPNPAPGAAHAHELFDEDDEPLPARAKDYAGAHGPPSSPESVRPRPAAGTPAPPSVIIATQHHVPMDSLGRVIQPHTELTRPALRTIRPPGTVQISIATLIVGAMTLVVLVLTAVLLLR
jgi:hypothetical protein